MGRNNAGRWRGGWMRLVGASLLGGLFVWAPLPSMAAGELRETEVVQAILRADPVLAQVQAQLRLADTQVEVSTARWSPSAYYAMEHFAAGSRLEREQELGLGATLVSPHQQASRDQAAYQRALTGFSAQRNVHARVMAGLRRFYAIVALQERLVILEHWREGLSQLAIVVQARVQAGEAPGYEKLRIDVAVRQADSEIRVARSTRAALLRSFADYLGIPAHRAQIAGALRPDLRIVRARVGKLRERSSWQALERARDGARQSQRRMKYAWLPSLSVNAGLRMRKDVQTYDWGFGLGINGAFASRKRVAAVRAAAVAREHSAQRTLDATAFFDEQRANQAAALCLALLEEQARYTQDMKDVLEPLERAVQAEYREGQRDVIGLMSVLDQSIRSQRYRLELARKARNAELDLRDAQGEFEQ